MINEELKIKIIQYLDGELDQELEKEIEEILDTDKDANDFCNQMKSLDINLKEFKNTSEYKDYSQRADNLIDKFIEQNIKESTFSNNFVNFFIGRNFLSYSLTAVLFLSVGLYFDEFLNIQDNQIKFDLKETIYEKNISKTRSSDESNELNEIFKETIEEAIENKSSQAKITYGSESYLIFINEKFPASENMICYSGNIYYKNQNEKFNYCYSKDNMHIIFAQ